MKLNNRGAASILVVLIIVVLATFGGIALTASWTNKKLAARAAQSKIDYYALDSVAEEIVANVDEILYVSMEDTVEYIEGICAKDFETIEEPDLLEKTVLSSYLPDIKSKAMRVMSINKLCNRIYFYNSALALSEYAQQNGMTLVFENGYQVAKDFLVSNKMPKCGDLKLEFIISEGEAAGDKSLAISIGVIPVSNEVKMKDDDVWYHNCEIKQMVGANRYKILSWKQSQNPIDYEAETPKFG